MNTKFMKAVLAGTAVAALGFGSTGAQAATASATANATILAPVTLTNNLSLEFGTIVPDAVGGTVTIDHAGAQTCSGALVCSGTTRAAQFTATATIGQTIDIDVPVTTATLNRSGGGASMLVSNLNLVGNVSATSVAMVGASYVFTVAGQLAVSGSQMAGVYQGSFNVNADYQ